MSSSKSEPPRSAAKPATEPEQSERQQSERLAAALRDNLKRRKAQARARRVAEPGRRDG
jgi:hypothetical protein